MNRSQVPAECQCEWIQCPACFETTALASQECEHCHHPMVSHIDEFMQETLTYYKKAYAIFAVIGLTCMLWVFLA